MTRKDACDGVVQNPGRSTRWACSVGARPGIIQGLSLAARQYIQKPHLRCLVMAVVDRILR